SIVIPFEAKSISITHSTTTATVTLTAHGYSVGDLITITGASQGAYNGTFTVTGVTANTFTYTMEDDPGANATGAPTVNKPIDVNYYRYYTSGGKIGLLKYVFGPRAYGRLDATFGDPLAQS